MMDSVTIKWRPTNYQQLSECEDCYVYAVSFQQKLLYIGMAYSQSVQARLQHQAHIRAKYQYLLDEITVWLGTLNYVSFARISEQRVRDIEALLIFLHQPPDNTQSKMSYRGRSNLVVRSRGCPLLEQEIAVREGIVYPARLRG
jgi:predicted GIY-YIG superfamily endonuclease